jgi:hypothetical protein
VGPLARSILGIMPDLTERLSSELYLCELDEKRRKEIRARQVRVDRVHYLIHCCTKLCTTCRGLSRRLQLSSPMIPSQRQEWTLGTLEIPNQCRRYQRKNGSETPWRRLLVGDEHKLRRLPLKSRQFSNDGHWTSASERHNVLEHRKAPWAPQH